MIPRIGITISQAGPTVKSQAYGAAVRAAGGEPVWILPADALDLQSVDAVLAPLHGLLLSGGVDIHPRYFGEAILADASVEVDDQRDTAELPLARRAVARGLPVLGICRGIQTLNVAFGGSLYQDLSLLGIDRPAHQQRVRQQLEDWQPAHAIDVTPGSRLAGIVGELRADVNSFHHQSVHRPAPEWVITARAPDGVIEGVELPTARFVVGVQWHPERMVTHDPISRRLFAAFLEASRA